MLLYLRPFRVGDYIETQQVSGTVKEIGLFGTHLETWDGLFVFAPNSAIWNTPLRNHARNPTRVMSIEIGISYDADPAEARRVLLEMAAADPRVLREPAPHVYVESYEDYAVKIVFRAAAPNAVFWDVQRAMVEEARRRLEGAGIEIPYLPHVLPAAAAAGAARSDADKGPEARS
jgi:small conductance mechanosensitive channel